MPARVLQGMTSGVSKAMFMCEYCELQSAQHPFVLMRILFAYRRSHERLEETGREEQGGT